MLDLCDKKSLLNKFLLFTLVYSQQVCFSQEPPLRFGKIDNAMYDLSRRKGLTIDSVTTFVNNKFSTTEHKVRAYYTFISLYLSYDVKAMTELKATPEFWNSGPIYHTTSQNPEKVFAEKKGVCEGISRLMVKLCEGSGIKAVMVTGDTKTPEGIVVTDLGHAWNAVKLDSGWTLMDITWSFGYLSPGKEFVRDHSNKYFNLDPDKFLKDHLPYDPMWQLCKKPINRSYFFNKDTSAEKFYSQNFNFSDSIIAYSKKTEADRNYSGLLSAYRFDKKNTDAAKTADAYINNRLAHNVNLASDQFSIFQYLFESKLKKNVTKNNCQKALEALNNSKTHIELALAILKDKTALTTEFAPILKRTVKLVNKLSLLVDQNIQMVKQLQKKVK